MYEAGDVELLKGHLSAFLYLGLILAVFGVFELDSRSGASGFKLYLDAEYPLGVEFIVACEHKAGNGYRGSVEAAVARWGVEAVDAIVFERSYSLAVADETVTGVAGSVDGLAMGGQRSCGKDRQ